MVMKCSLFQYQKKFINSKFEIKINLLKSRVKRKQSNFTFLWHNSSFNTRDWIKFQYLYKKVLK